jgi:hypothetical protein
MHFRDRLEITLMERNDGSRITIHRVKKRQVGEAEVGCRHDAIQILYKESTTRTGNVHGAYLAGLLGRHGFAVTDGDAIKNTPLMHLCVTKAGGEVTREDVVAVLESDPEIDVSGIDLPEGHTGSE